MVIGRADGLVIRDDYSMFAYDKNFTSPVYLLNYYDRSCII